MTVGVHEYGAGFFFFYLRDLSIIPFLLLYVYFPREAFLLFYIMYIERNNIELVSTSLKKMVVIIKYQKKIIGATNNSTVINVSSTRICVFAIYNN